MAGISDGKLGFYAPGADDETKHHCPGCGKTLPLYHRYPWYFCSDCLEDAEDEDGCRLEFANVDGSGGFQWRRDGSADWQIDVRLRCLLRGRPVMVSEARFGGIVAQPIDSSTQASLDFDDRLRVRDASGNRRR